MHDDTAITTADGCRLEAQWADADHRWAGAVVTHPHPLMGGDMFNPVPSTAFSTLPDHGVAALRFNFRGAGRSTGEHGGGTDEIGDVEAALDHVADVVGDQPLVGVGYSFGADVLLAVDDPRLALVVVVAPPLRVLDPAILRAPRGPAPTLVLSPEHDQFCDADQAATVVAGWPETTVEAIPGGDHFLAGRQRWLADRLGVALSTLRTATD